MFCKFCGQTLTPSSVRCERCGREVPAASDCGGFYQIMPDAAGKAGAMPAQPAAPFVQPQADYTDHKGQANGKLPLILLSAVLVVALVLLSVLWGQVGSLKSQLTGLEKEISKLSNKLEDHLDMDHGEDVPNPDGGGSAATTVPMEETTAHEEEVAAPREEPTTPIEETTAPVEETTAPTIDPNFDLFPEGSAPWDTNPADGDAEPGDSVEISPEEPSPEDDEERPAS